MFVTAPAMRMVSMPRGSSCSFKLHLPGKNALAPDFTATMSSLCGSSSGQSFVQGRRSAGHRIRARQHPRDDSAGSADDLRERLLGS
jgi:hypothetical protein